MKVAHTLDNLWEFAALTSFDRIGCNLSLEQLLSCFAHGRGSEEHAKLSMGHFEIYQWDSSSSEHYRQVMAAMFTDLTLAFLQSKVFS